MWRILARSYCDEASNSRTRIISTIFESLLPAAHVAILTFRGPQPTSERGKKANPLKEDDLTTSRTIGRLDYGIGARRRDLGGEGL
jgi:hypothetical protein